MLNQVQHDIHPRRQEPFPDGIFPVGARYIVPEIPEGQNPPLADGFDIIA